MTGLAVKFSFLLLLLITPQYVLCYKNSYKYKKPCKQIVLYYHDILFGRTKNIASNSTAARVANASAVGGFQFGSLIIFDDPVTKDQNLHSPPVAKAQGMYFYDERTDYSAMFAFTLIFNSTEYKGTLSIMGADPLAALTRDLSVMGGTGDFFMTRGIVTFSTQAIEGIEYFRLKLDIKLYEC